MTQVTVLDTPSWFVPGAEAPDFNAIAEPRQSQAPSTDSPQVLIVETDTALLVSLTESLAGLGVQVRATASAREAHELIERGHFAGIFVGLALWNGEGIELIREIRLSWWNSHSPIV